MHTNAMHTYAHAHNKQMVLAKGVHARVCARARTRAPLTLFELNPNESHAFSPARDSQHDDERMSEERERERCFSSMKHRIRTCRCIYGRCRACANITHTCDVPLNRGNLRMHVFVARTMSRRLRAVAPNKIYPSNSSPTLGFDVAFRSRA